MSNLNEISNNLKLQLNNDLEKEFEVKSEITKIFSSKLNILDCLSNILSKNEYQRIVGVVSNELENIINIKEEKEKLQICSNMKNIFNYTSDECNFGIGFYNNLVPEPVDILDKDQIKYLNEESKKEIFFYKGSYIDKILKVYIKYECLDIYKYIIHNGLKNRRNNDDDNIHYYSQYNDIYLMIDTFIDYEMLIEMKEDNIKSPFSGRFSKFISSYTINDIIKLCNDGYNLYMLFKEMTNNKQFTMILSFEYYGKKYFKYNNTVYVIDYDYFAKKLFQLK